MKLSLSFKFLTRFCLVILLTFSLLTPEVLSVSPSITTKLNLNQINVTKIESEIEIPADSDYYIRFDSRNLTLNKQDIKPTTNGFSEQVIAAIVKSPHWIQRRLTSQFHNLSNSGTYADILLNSSEQTADEIAFSIACSPSGKVPPASLLKENAESLYKHDQWIHYADIIDIADGTGNYSSTIRYRILENGTEKYVILPPDIYYWYIVHPKITVEDNDSIYGPLWRSYLFNHNDIGYPLLKEKISTIQYLWDCTSYSQPGYRLWTECIAQHPTAIEAVSYWVGKTVPFPAIGDRPGQSCIIAHEHNGWCGELQRIAIAAQRAALIPTVSASNVGEDHVWREFYERGWHENDNWWSDTGGAVDQPDVYAYGWGKNMSAIYQWKGDGTIQQDTAYYIHQEDRITISFEVKDFHSQPVDGVRVVVLVKGLKDITYYTNLIWENIQKIWDKLPEIIKGRLLTSLFETVKERFNQLPDTITGVTIATWDYTNSMGRCNFELGKNLEYIFLIQEGNLKKPWQLAHYNTLRSLDAHTNKEFKILIPDTSKKPLHRTSKEMPSGDCRFDLSFTSNAYQPVQHFINDGIGRQETIGNFVSFFVDPDNFQRYQNGDKFTCYQFIEGTSGTFSSSFLLQDWYLIFRNPNRLTNIIIDYSFSVAIPTTTEHVTIVSPDTTLFETPTFNINNTIPFSGVATTDHVGLTIDQQPQVYLPVINDLWYYTWDTSETLPGLHHITVTTPSGTSDELLLLLLDASPPSVFIETPIDGDIVQSKILTVSGHSVDNVAVDHIEISLDNETRRAIGTTSWNLTWDITALPLGDHILSVKAIDTQGLVSIQTCFFTLNQSDQCWGPQIQTLSHTPTNPTNTSNVIIYADVATTAPFTIDKVILYCSNGINTMSYEMYRYGQYPIQTRHEEDPLRNQSNTPVFGVELGQFQTGQTISYWIVVMDTAQIKQQSDVHSFTVL